MRTSIELSKHNQTGANDENKTSLEITWRTIQRSSLSDMQNNRIARSSI